MTCSPPLLRMPLNSPRSPPSPLLKLPFLLTGTGMSGLAGLLKRPLNGDCDVPFNRFSSLLLSLGGDGLGLSGV